MEEQQKVIEQLSQGIANVLMDELPDCKERLYALMNLEQTMLWYYQYITKEAKKAEAEVRSES